MHDVGFIAILLSQDIEENANVLLSAIEYNCTILIYTNLWDDDPRELWEIPEAKELFWDTFSTTAIKINREDIEHSVGIILSRLHNQTKEVMEAMLLIHGTKKRKSKPTPPWSH